MRKEGRFGKYRTPASVIYCSATSYPKSLWLVTSTVLFAHDSVDVQFRGRAQRGLFISSPHGVSQAHLGLEDPRYLTAMRGSSSGYRLQRPCSCYKHVSLSNRLAWTSFFTWWLRNCRFLRSVIQSITSA